MKEPSFHSVQWCVLLKDLLSQTIWNLGAPMWHISSLWDVSKSIPYSYLEKSCVSDENEYIQSGQLFAICFLYLLPFWSMDAVLGNGTAILGQREQKTQAQRGRMENRRNLLPQCHHEVTVTALACLPLGFFLCEGNITVYLVKCQTTESSPNCQICY